MFDYMLTEEQIKIRDDVRDLVKWVPRQMILDMDDDKIRFPKEFLQEAGRRNLMGCRYPKKWGGRDMDWCTTCMIIAHEWYREYFKMKEADLTRDFESDALGEFEKDARDSRFRAAWAVGEEARFPCIAEKWSYFERGMTRWDPPSHDQKIAPWRDIRETPVTGGFIKLEGNMA